MLVVATALVIVGVVVALLGERVFRVALPIIGFVAGLMVGFSGVQAVFGVNAISLPIAVITGVLVGALMAVLSYLYFDIAVMVLVAALSMYALVFLGVALGLQDNGFILTVLAFAGIVGGVAIALAAPVSRSLVVVVSSFYGVAMVLCGILLVAGDLSLNDLQEHGILRAVTDTVKDQFVWILVWVGGGLISTHVQLAASKVSLLDDSLAYKE